MLKAKLSFGTTIKIFKDMVLGDVAHVKLPIRFRIDPGQGSALSGTGSSLIQVRGQPCWSSISSLSDASIPIVAPSTFDWTGLRPYLTIRGQNVCIKVSGLHRITLNPAVWSFAQD